MRRPLRTTSVIVGLGAAIGLVHADDVERGREIAHDVYKGNCLACHRIPGDATAVTLANIGPPLVAMKQRFPERESLHAQIWDSTSRNPNSVMPPFGKHHILSAEEIDLVVSYVYQY